MLATLAWTCAISSIVSVQKELLPEKPTMTETLYTAIDKFWISQRWTIVNPNPRFLKWEVNKSLSTNLHTAFTGYLNVPWIYQAESGAAGLELKLRVTAIMKTDMVVRNAGPYPQKPLFFHCGGPGSIDTCASKLLGLPKDIQEQFYGIGIAQRGMVGDPLFGVPIRPEGQIYINSLAPPETGEECQLLKPWPPAPGATYNLMNVTKNCPCIAASDAYYAAGGVEPRPDADYMELEQVQAQFSFSDNVMRQCYNLPYYHKTGPDGRSYNFLDYVGTQLLGSDINLLRQAIGAEKLNIDGASYGTAVGSVYASMFPEYTDRILLNGNMFRGPNTYEFVTDVAEATSQVVYKLNRICDDADTNAHHLDWHSALLGTVRIRSPCIENPAGNSFRTEAIFETLLAQVRNGSFTVKIYDGTTMPITVGMVCKYIMNFIRGTGDGYKAASWFTAIKTMSALASANSTIRQAATLEVLFKSCGFPKTPSGMSEQKFRAHVLSGEEMALPDEPQSFNWYWFGTCGPSMYSSQFATNLAPLSLDYIGRYTIARATKLIGNLMNSYGLLEVTAAMGIAGLMIWPAKAAPVAYGWRQGVKALIVGNLYDGATPMQASKWMRNAFPDGALLTWQGIGHCVSEGRTGSDYDPEGVQLCIDRMNHYLSTGTLPRDGTTCRISEPISLKTRKEERSLV